MTLYNCTRCNRGFDHKGNFTRHVNRKNPCKIVKVKGCAVGELYCEYCKKTFANFNSLNRHLDNPKLGCFHKKQQEKQQEEYKKQQELIYRVKYLEEFIKKQNEQMNKLLNDSNASTINTITNIHSDAGTININKTLKPKRNVNGNTKRIVAHSQQWICNICKEILPANYETDHIKPLYNGGSNDLSNLQALCNNCHSRKTN